MKSRIISSIVMIVICVPLFLLGGYFFDVFALVVGCLALKEFIDIKQTKKKLPDFIKFICYVLLVLITLSFSNNISSFNIDYRIICGIFLTFLVPSILYHDKEKYSINDVFYLVGGIFFLGLSFRLMILYRSIGLSIITYLIIISVFTDVFALVTGMLIGKNKLIEIISPKKTIEGMIGGTLMATITGTIFFVNIINPNISVITISLVTLFLSIMGQIGDLFFSNIKRYYGKKDFSNLIPGHGGILDRFDNLIFVMLSFMFFISLI